jgi:hypothetical protein
MPKTNGALVAARFAPLVGADSQNKKSRSHGSPIAFYAYPGNIGFSIKISTS